MGTGPRVPCPAYGVVVRGLVGVVHTFLGGEVDFFVRSVCLPPSLLVYLLILLFSYSFYGIPDRAYEAPPTAHHLRYYIVLAW